MYPALVKLTPNFSAHLALMTCKTTFSSGALKSKCVLLHNIVISVQWWHLI